MKQEKEIWKDVLNYEGFYQVSNLGRVKSIDRIVKRNNYEVEITGKILNLPVHQSGYIRLSLCKRGKIKSRYVHTLVLESFVCARPNKQDADHRDRNRTNNKLSNLRWWSIKLNRSMAGYNNPNNVITRRYKKIKL